MINRGTQTLHGTQLGMFADFDLGNPNDDYIGSDVARGMMYVLNGDNDDETGSTVGYGVQPPAFGIVMLQGPYQDYDGIDNPNTPVVQNAIDSIGISYSALGIGYGDGVIDNERRGLSGTRTFLNGGGATGAPVTAIDYYNQLRGSWNDNSPQYYGGTGHYLDPNADTSTTAAYAYPDVSDQLGVDTGGIAQAPWSEVISSQFPGDRRMLGRTGGFTLEPGAYNSLDFAFVFARATSGGPQASVQALQMRVDSVRDYFESNLLPITAGRQDPWCPGATVVTSVQDVAGSTTPVQVYPIPATDMITVSISDRTEVNRTAVIYDLTGKVVADHKLQGFSTDISIAELERGVYLLKLPTAEGQIVHRFVKQ